MLAEGTIFHIDDPFLEMSYLAHQVLVYPKMPKLSRVEHKARHDQVVRLSRQRSLDVDSFT